VYETAKVHKRALIDKVELKKYNRVGKAKQVKSTKKSFD